MLINHKEVDASKVVENAIWREEGREVALAPDCLNDPDVDELEEEKSRIEVPHLTFSKKDVLGKTLVRK